MQHTLLQLDRKEREHSQLTQQLPGDTIMLENMHDEWLMPYSDAAYSEMLKLKVSAHNFQASEQRAASSNSVPVCTLHPFHEASCWADVSVVQQMVCMSATFAVVHAEPAWCQCRVYFAYCLHR